MTAMRSYWRSAACSAVCGALALSACAAPPRRPAHPEDTVTSAPLGPASASTPAATPSPDGALDAAHHAAHHVQGSLAPPSDRPAPATLATDDGPLPLLQPVPLEDPTGQALAAFHAALARAERGEGTARIAFYGASHVAADLFTDVVRRRLQARFGDAGPGALMPAKPWRWHRHARAEYLRQRALTPMRVRARARRDDSYGLMGLSFDSGRLRAIAKLRTRGADPDAGGVDQLELYYLKQPGGGRVRVFIDGKGMRTLRTAADRPQPAYARFEVPAGDHEIELRTQADGPVRIHSLVAEHAGPGVVLDTLGIPGARARYHLQWNDPIYRAHLQHRAPDLVVLAYGTNESGDDDVPVAAYERRLDAVLQRIAAAVPQASCLLIGPSDRPLRVPPPEPGSESAAALADAGTLTAQPLYAPRPRTAQVVAAQRRAAARHGCAFFDLHGFMGGELSMLRWVAAEPPLGAPDHIHFTRAGYEALGEHLAQVLVADYAPAPDTGAEPETLLAGQSGSPSSAPTGERKATPEADGPRPEAPTL